VSERLTQTELLRFAYGEADELEEVILSDPEYLEVLEQIWAGEMSRDLSGPLVRTLQMQKMVSDTMGAVLDLTVAFGRAIPHYLAGGQTNGTTPDPESDPESSD